MNTATVAVRVPAAPADYGRYLAGRVAAYAALVRRDQDLPLGDLEREQLADAARELLAALEPGER